MAYKANALDMIEAIGLPQECPVFYIVLEVKPHLDMEKVRKAVKACEMVVPQFGCGYERKKGMWVPAAEKNMVIVCDTLHFDGWDLAKGPQLQVQIVHQQHSDLLAFGFSHVLCDGQGAKQTVDLWLRSYEGEDITHMQNIRNLSAYEMQPFTKVEKRKAVIPWKLPKKNAQQTERRVHQCAISLQELKQVGRQCHVSINDVLLCAYAQTIAQISKRDAFSLPCPVDLRPFVKEPLPCTIANFTGDYWITLSDMHTRCWKEIAADIHYQMKQERKRNQDLKTILHTMRFTKYLPNSMIGLLAPIAYQLPPLSFTNLGKLDIQVSGHTLSSVSVITRPRVFPSFQISIITANDTCAFTAHVDGSSIQQKQSERILHTFCAFLHHYAFACGKA